MRRGFKTQCESISAEIRAEIGLDARAPLDPRQLAQHLEIPVHPLSALKGGGVKKAIRQVNGGDRSILSALTIFPNWPSRQRIIVYNDFHSLARQNSDVSHELSHGLLLHEPRHAIINGCRDYNKTEEDEAAWLSGCLLVPRDAAVQIAKAQQPLSDAADTYGVSLDMMTWRINSTGAQRQANAARTRRSQRG